MSVDRDEFPPEAPPLIEIALGDDFPPRFGDSLDL